MPYPGSAGELARSNISNNGHMPPRQIVWVHDKRNVQPRYSQIYRYRNPLEHDLSRIAAGKDVRLLRMSNCGNKAKLVVSGRDFMVVHRALKHTGLSVVRMQAAPRIHHF